MVTQYVQRIQIVYSKKREFLFETGYALLTYIIKITDIMASSLFKCTHTRDWSFEIAH